MTWPLADSHPYGPILSPLSSIGIVTSLISGPSLRTASARVRAALDHLGDAGGHADGWMYVYAPAVAFDLHLLDLRVEEGGGGLAPADVLAEALDGRAALRRGGERAMRRQFG